MANNIGIINEQGYPEGQLGFKPLTEAEQEKLKPLSEKPKTTRPRVGDVFEEDDD